YEDIISCKFMFMIIEKTIEFVKEKLQGAEAGHDWSHIERVYKNAIQIAQGSNDINVLVVELGALLHDIADSKFHNGDESVGPKIAREFLQMHQVDENVIREVVSIIENISFKNTKDNTNEYTSKELQIVQDADRLDAIGAIGIARTFNYGGFKNRELYNPQVKPNLNMSKEEYKNSKAPTINHFYEKLLLLKDKMNTQKGRELAEERHRFMEIFLEQFYKEWGESV